MFGTGTGTIRGIERRSPVNAADPATAAAAVRQPRKKSSKINPLFFFALFYIPRMERSFFLLVYVIHTL